MAKSGGANILKRKYFYGKKSKSYGAPLKSGGAAASAVRHRQYIVYHDIKIYIMI